MMPLMLADAGTEQLIHKVGGSPEVKKHLEEQVKESRVAISEEMARKIMV